MLVTIAAALTLVAVSLAKQGWIGDWAQNAIPANQRPLFAILVAVVATGGSAIGMGQGWQAALTQGLAAGAVAIATHGAVVQLARRGREIIPQAPWVAAPKAASKRKGARS